MKKSLLFAALITSAASFGACPQGSSCSSLYVGAGLGIEAVPSTYDASGTGLSLKVGTHLDSFLPKLGAEVEYTKSVVAIKRSSREDVNVQTVAAYLTYDITFPRSPMFVRPRIGFMLPNSGDKINSTDFGLSAGADVGVMLNKHVNAYVGYTNMGETVNDYILGLEYKF